MITCTKRFDEIPFAHRQPTHDGHCSYIHGHNWVFELEFGAEQMDLNGFVVDFGKMDLLKELFDQFDHALVLRWNDPFSASIKIDRPDPDRPTMYWVDDKGTRLAKLILVDDVSCEGLATLIGAMSTQIVDGMTAGRAKVVRVTVFEDQNNSSTWRPI